jgi:hypothetical protein
MPDLLPDSRLAQPTGVKRLVNKLGSLNYVPIFCANCGAEGGMVPEENMTFAFYLCNPCAEKWTPLVDTCMVPDQLFWQKVNEAQLENYGRILSGPEIQKELQDPNSILSMLAREKRSAL